MRKLIAVAAVLAAGVGVGGTAFAGEQTGGPEPKPTPIADHTAGGSICAFSGQNDAPEGDMVPVDENDPESELVLDPLSVGRVQSWGQTLNLAAKTFLPEGTKGKAALKPDMQAFGPGASCRGYASADD